jgi:ABC-2 type transport system ATP-binding protein
MVASITAENLTKRFSRTQPAALDNLNLDIKAGEVYGYLGANGAGKSTTN